jgi:hypothetical protein
MKVFSSGSTEASRLKELSLYGKRIRSSDSSYAVVRLMFMLRVYSWP